MEVITNATLVQIELKQDWGIETRPDLIDRVKFENEELLFENVSIDAMESLEECEKITLCFNIKTKDD